MQIDDTSGRVTVSNEGERSATFYLCARAKDGAADAPIPDWLDVHPTSGEVQPQVRLSPTLVSSLERECAPTLAERGHVELIPVASGESGRGSGRPLLVTHVCIAYLAL